MVSLDRLADALYVLEDVKHVKDEHLREAWGLHNEEEALGVHAEAVEPVEDTDSAADEEGERDRCSDWLQGMLVVGSRWGGGGRRGRGKGSGR